MEQYTEILKVILLIVMVFVGLIIAASLLLMLIREIKNK